MLPAKARLTDRDDFTTVVRRGRRAGRTLVVVHVLLPDPVEQCGSDGRASDVGSPAALSQVATPQVGFVVSKAVGGSVVRHRVARRLRHLMRDRLVDVPPGSRIVVRALPAAAAADSASLGADLDRALRGALHSKGPGRRGSNPDARNVASLVRAAGAQAVSRRP